MKALFGFLALPLVVLAPVPFAKAQFNGCGTGLCAPLAAGVAVPNYTPNIGLPIWRACRDRIRAGTIDQCPVVLISESTGAAFDATYATITNDASCCGLDRALAGILRTVYGVDAQTNNFLGNRAIDGFSGGSSAAYLEFDTRVTSLGNWIIATFIGPQFPGGFPFVGGNTAITFHPTDVVSFPSTPAINTDRIDLYAVYTGTANMTVKVGATTLCTIPPGLSNTKQTCNATRGDNTYSINCDVQFQCNFAGASARDSTAHQVVILNASFGGATVAQQASTIDILDQMAPVLCIINDLGNDQGQSTPVNAFIASNQTIISRCKLTGDVLMTTGVVGNNPTYPPAVVTVAATNNVPVWNSAALGGASGWSPPTNDNYGWDGAWDRAALDPNHPGAAGYAVWASFVAQILMQ
jgi:lysophospholipase L1-like esterase